MWIHLCSLELLEEEEEKETLPPSLCVCVEQGRELLVCVCVREEKTHSTVKHVSLCFLMVSELDQLMKQF